MASDAHKTGHPHTPPPDIAAEKAPGRPVGSPPTATAARGKLVGVIRAAERERIERYNQLQEEIAGLEQVHTDQISAAWRQYDEDLARLRKNE